MTTHPPPFAKPLPARAYVSLITIHLPWPSPVLSPNARKHWRPVAKAKAAARHDGKVLALEALGRRPKPASGPLRVSLTFRPPDARARDQDNAIASLKAACDGIADALGVNDSMFRFAEPVWDEPCRPHGEVEVTVEAI